MRPNMHFVSLSPPADNMHIHQVFIFTCSLCESFISNMWTNANTPRSLCRYASFIRCTPHILRDSHDLEVQVYSVEGSLYHVSVPHDHFDTFNAHGWATLRWMAIWHTSYIEDRFIYIRRFVKQWGVAQFRSFTRLLFLTKDIISK